MDVAPVSSLLRGFLSDWSRSRPAPTTRYDTGPPRVSAHEWLADETARKGYRVGEDQIEQIAAERTRYRHVELRAADALLTAIGRPDALATIPVRPNPNASQTARACCGWSNYTIREFDVRTRSGRLRV